MKFVVNIFEKTPFGRKALEEAEKRTEIFLEKNKYGLYRGEALLDVGTAYLVSNFDIENGEKWLTRAAEWFDNVQNFDKDLKDFELPDSVQKVYQNHLKLESEDFMPSIFWVIPCFFLFYGLEELDDLLNSQQFLWEQLLKSEGFEMRSYPKECCSATLRLNENDGTLTLTVTNIRFDYLQFDLWQYFSSPVPGESHFAKRLGFLKVEEEQSTPAIGFVSTGRRRERSLELESDESFSKSIKIWDVRGRVSWNDFCKMIEIDKAGKFEVYFTIDCQAKLTLNDRIYEGEHIIEASLPIDYKTVQKIKQIQLKENKDSKK